LAAGDELDDEVLDVDGVPGVPDDPVVASAAVPAPMMTAAVAPAMATLRNMWFLSTGSTRVPRSDTSTVPRQGADDDNSRSGLC
jgi:hypothetical protein